MRTPLGARAVLLVLLASSVVAGCGVRVRRAERQAGRVADVLAAGDTAVFLTPFGGPQRPFSPAVRVGNLIYLSGQIGLDNAAASGSTLVPGGIEAETRQTMENIKTTLAAVGSSMDKVIKCTIMMADMKEWDRMNVIYRTYFKEGRFPARSAFGTTGIALGARVEIECVALA